MSSFFESRYVEVVSLVWAAGLLVATSDGASGNLELRVAFPGPGRQLER